MPTVSGHGVQLCWEETGEGTPLVWVHEYGGDLRSWEPQVRYFARRYCVIAYNQRGYPPSTVPGAARDYALAFPTVWGVECRMGGHDRPTLTEAEMRREVYRKIGRAFALAPPVY